MKKEIFMVIGVLLFAHSLFLHAQGRPIDSYGNINYEKLESVVEEKTQRLDEVVHLNKGKQKKKAYQIYKDYEIKKQKKLANTKFKQRNRYKERPHRKQSSYTEYDEQKENLLLEKLDKQASEKIKEILTQKQKKRLFMHEEKEKMAILQ
ncbi:hypothetical protein ACEZ3G_08955 [Maribacter algicola]|uniref:Uncharacterized protein n=1 Tax=Meishania litoralis TaxID=3434685 RepID=A0ACC7LNP6_9FLAO